LILLDRDENELATKFPGGPNDARSSWRHSVMAV